MGQAILIRRVFSAFLPKLPNGVTLPDLAESIANLDITVQYDTNIGLTFVMQRSIKKGEELRIF